MKPIKMLGLAALAALMAMAFAGASSAMAESTVLCTADESPCEPQNIISHVHETSVGKAKLLSSPTVECTVLFLGDTVGVETTPLVISGTFTYSSCNNSCTVTEESGPSEVEVLRTASELAAVTGEGLVKLNCFFGFINCKYNGEGLEGHGLGPLTSSQANGSVVIEEQETHVEAGGCPETAFLDIETTPLVKAYIKAAPPMACIYTGTANGRFTGGSTNDDGRCTGQVAQGSGEYELALSSNTTLNAHVCAFVGTGNGKWLNLTNGSACANSHTTGFPGTFALGVVR